MRSQFPKPATPFRENPECVLRAVSHHGEHTTDKIKRYVFMKQIAHGINENQSRDLPSQWQLNQVPMQSYSEAVAVPLYAHRLKTLGQALRVAMSAVKTNLRTPADRIPSCLDPLDFRVGCHPYPRKIF